MEKTKDLEEIANESSSVLGKIENILENMKKSILSVNEIALKEKNISDEIGRAIETVSSAVEDTYSITAQSIKMVDIQESKNKDMIQYSDKLIDVGEKLQHLTIRLKKGDEIVFGINPFTSPENIKNMYVPILEKVCTSIGYKARTIIVRSYEDLTKGINSGIIDVGWFSPFAYVNANKACNVQPLVTPKVNGKYSYNGYIIAKKGTNIERIEDLKNSNFGYVDKNSASGYLYARHIIKNSKLNPDNIFKKVSFMGSHDNVIKAVLSGEIDAGATYNEAFEMATKSGIDTSKLIIIAKTEEIPKDAIATNNKLPKDLCEKLKEAFVSYNSLGKSNSSIEGFVESSDEKYNVIRAVLKK